MPDVSVYKTPPSLNVNRLCQQLLLSLDSPSLDNALHGEAIRGGFDMGYYVRGEPLPKRFDFENLAQAQQLLDQLDAVSVLHVRLPEGDVFAYFEPQRLILRGYDAPRIFARWCEVAQDFTAHP